MKKVSIAVAILIISGVLFWRWVAVSEENGHSIVDAENPYHGNLNASVAIFRKKSFWGGYRYRVAIIATVDRKGTQEDFIYENLPSEWSEGLSLQKMYASMSPLTQYEGFPSIDIQWNREEIRYVYGNYTVTKKLPERLSPPGHSGKAGI